MGPPQFTGPNIVNGAAKLSQAFGDQRRECARACAVMTDSSTAFVDSVL